MRTIRVVATVVTAAAVLAGCSSNDGTPVAAPPTSAPSTTVAAPTSSQNAPTQTSTEQTITSAESPTQAAYTPTSVQVTGSTDRAIYDVTLPQVSGGNKAVTDRFNASMRVALQDQINGFGNDKFTLESGRDNVVHIGAHVISGLLSLGWDANPPGAHGDSIEATITIDADDATPVTLQRVFPNLDAGLQRLSDQAAALLPATKAGPNFERTGIEPKVLNFANWLATPAGMEIRFGDYQVGPYAIGLVQVTVPWDSLSGVIDPAMKSVLSS